MNQRNSVCYEYEDKVRFMKEELGQRRGTDMTAFREELSTLQRTESYREYLYFKHEFQIINHMAEMPEKAYSRKLPFLILDKNYDGTYYIHGDMTVKYPEFGDILWDVEHTICGFLVRENSVELFDAYEAVGMFGVGVKEAFASGRCTISERLY